MKFNVNINQKQLSKVDGIDLKDAAILVYVEGFMNSRKTKKILVGNITYIWISYAHLIDEMPLLKLKSKDAIYRRFRKLTNAGLLEPHKDNRSMGKSYYAFGPIYESIISDSYKGKPTDEKTEGVRMKNQSTCGQKVGGGTDEITEEHSISKHSTNESNTNNKEAPLKNLNEQAIEIVNHLAEGIGKNLMTKISGRGSSNVTNAKKLLRKKYSVDEIKNMIAMKIFEWTGTDNEINLTPETLFGRASKSSGYVDRAIELASDPVAKQKFINQVNLRKERYKNQINGNSKGKSKGGFSQKFAAEVAEGIKGM